MSMEIWGKTSLLPGLFPAAHIYYAHDLKALLDVHIKTFTFVFANKQHREVELIGSELLHCNVNCRKYCFRRAGMNRLSGNEERA